MKMGVRKKFPISQQIWAGLPCIISELKYVKFGSDWADKRRNLLAKGTYLLSSPAVSLRPSQWFHYCPAGHQLLRRSSQWGHLSRSRSRHPLCSCRGTMLSKWGTSTHPNIAPKKGCYEVKITSPSFLDRTWTWGSCLDRNEGLKWAIATFSIFPWPTPFFLHPHRPDFQISTGHRSLFLPTRCRIRGSEPHASQSNYRPHPHEKLPGHDLPHVFSRSATSLPFGSFVVFIIVIRRLLLFFLSTLSFGLLFNTRFGHCSGMRR